VLGIDKLCAVAFIFKLNQFASIVIMLGQNLKIQKTKI
jgi:hypothetical protein